MSKRGANNIAPKLKEIKMRDEHVEKYGGFPFDDDRYKIPLFNEIETRSILRILALKEGEIVADLGCGIGRFTFEILEAEGPDEIDSKPEDGVYVYGLFIEGGRYDRETGYLADSFPGKMVETMPCIHFIPKEDF